MRFSESNFKHIEQQATLYSMSTLQDEMQVKGSGLPISTLGHVCSSMQSTRVSEAVCDTSSAPADLSETDRNANQILARRDQTKSNLPKCQTNTQLRKPVY